MHSRLLLLLTLFVAAGRCAQPLVAEAGLPVTQAFGVRDTGASGVYWTGVQDERGMLYFGCDVVLSYDGEHWRRHPVPGSFEVRSLAVGSHGRLWVGGSNELGYFERSATGGLSDFHTLRSFLPADASKLGDVWHVFPTAAGAVFVSSDAVLVWNGHSFRVHHLPGARRLLAMRSGGRIFISHQPTGIWSLEGADLRSFIGAERIHHAAAMWMERAGDAWLLATKDGLRSWSTAGESEVLPEASAFIRTNVLTSVCRNAQGDLCLATLNQGVAIFAPTGEIRTRLTAANGLQSSSVMFIFCDRDGALWVGSSLGLTRVATSSGVTSFDQQQGLRGKPCRRITQFGERLMVATDDGIFQLRAGSGAEPAFAPVPELAGNYLDALGDGRSVSVAGYKGVTRWDGTTAATIFSTDRDVVVLARSRVPDTLLLADDNNLVRLNVAVGGESRPEVLARLPDRPTSVAESGDGEIWAGSRSGAVFRVAGGGTTGEPSYDVIAAGERNGPSVVARLGSGVAVCTSDGIRFHQPGVDRLVAVRGAPERGAAAVSNPGPDGTLWVALHSPFTDGTRLPTIGRIAFGEEGVPVWQPVAVDGLNRVGGVNALFIDGRGILWIGGGDGLLRVPSAGLPQVAVPHTPVIQPSMPEGARISFRHNAAAFEYGAVEYGRREFIRFQTRLAAMDGEWSPPTNSSQLALAGLRDGDYEFAVRTVNDAGLVSPPVVWHFTVLPPWYRTPLAYSGWGLLVLLGFLGGVQWRSAYLRRQNVRLEALVQKKTEQLEKANAAKSEFLANMSHEIRNPISGIVGLSLAMEETSLDERQRQLADSIRSCAGLLATLVDDVLDFSKIEAGRIELRPAPFDLRAHLEQCAAMVAEDARRAGSTIQLDLAPTVPDRLFGDAARVQQIVLNFLTNAVKFGLGNPISVEASPGANGRVRLSVRDHGPGLSSEEAATLFTKFSRLEQARVANIRGTGLGLAVCRLLAEKMGGVVGVDSARGAGSCFWAELPLIAEAERAGPPTGGLTALPAHRLRALIVEDIAYNATAMQAVLRKLGIDSDVASDGPAALQRLETTAYDVAFMDWSLPGMIGTEVVRRYRAVEPPDRRTVIIATTAYSGDLNREACLAAGMDAFIAKPFTPEKISAALRDLRGSLRAAASVVVGSPAGAAPAGPASEFDLQMLRFLADESPQGLAVQIARYLEAFDADRQRLRELLPTGDAREIHRVAHRLVSHASAIKYLPLVTLASALQAQAATAERPVLHNLLAEFDAEFARLREKLGSIRSSTGSA